MAITDADWPSMSGLRRCPVLHRRRNRRTPPRPSPTGGGGQIGGVWAVVGVSSERCWRKIRQRLPLSQRFSSLPLWGRAGVGLKIAAAGVSWNGETSSTLPPFYIHQPRYPVCIAIHRKFQTRRVAEDSTLLYGEATQHSMRLSVDGNKLQGGF